LAEMTSHIQGIIDYAGEVTDAGISLGNRYMQATDDMGISAATSVQAIEKSAAEALGEAREQIGTGIIGKPQNLMNQVTAQNSYATEKANNIKYRMSIADAQMKAAEQALANGAMTLEKLPATLQLASTQVKDTVKTGDLHSKSVGDEIAGYAHQGFAKMMNELDGKLDSSKTDLTNSINENVKHVDTEVTNLKELAAQVNSDQSGYRDMASGQNVQAQYSVGAASNTASNLATLSAEEKAKLIAGLDGAINEFDGQIKSADDARKDVVTGAEKEERGEGLAEAGEVGAALDGFQGQVSSVLASIFNVLASADKKTGAETAADNKQVQQMLAAGFTDIQGALEKINALREASSPSAYSKAGAAGDAALAIMKMSADEQAQLAMKLGVSKNEIFHSIMGATSDLKVGPGGTDEMLRTLKNSINSDLMNLDDERGTVLNAFRASKAQIEEGSSHSLQAMQEQARLAGGSVGAASRDVNEFGESMSTKLSGWLADVDSKVKGQEASVKALAASARSQDEAMRDRAAGIKGKISARQKLLDEEAMRFETSVGGVVDALDTTGMAVKEGDRIKGLERGLVGQENQEKAAASHLNDAADVLIKNVEYRVEHAAEGFKPFKATLDKEENAESGKLGQVGSQIAATTSQVETFADDMTTVAQDLETHVKHRHEQLVTKLNAVKGQLADVLGASEFSTAGALDETVARIGNAVKEDNQLLSKVELEITPQTEGWRNKVYNQFQNLGLALDLDKVAERANVSLNKEKAMRAQERGAAGHLEEGVMQARRLATESMRALEKKSKFDMAGTMAREDMTTAQKLEEVAHVKDHMEHQATMLLSKAQSILNDQKTASLSISEQRALLATTVQRSDHISDPIDLSSPGATEQKTQLSSMAAALGAVKDSVMSTIRRAVPGSLTEVDEKISTNDASLSKLLPTWEEKIHKMDAKREAEDADLAAGLDALNK